MSRINVLVAFGLIIVGTMLLGLGFGLAAESQDNGYEMDAFFYQISFTVACSTFYILAVVFYFYLPKLSKVKEKPKPQYCPVCGSDRYYYNRKWLCPNCNKDNFIK